MNIFWLCLRSLWSSRRKEEDEQMIWRVLQGVTRKKRTATDLLVLTRLFGT